MRHVAWSFLATQPGATSDVAEFHYLELSAHTLAQPSLPIEYFFLSSLKPEREVQTGRLAQA